MIRINQMKLNIEHTSDDFERKILKTLCIVNISFPTTIGAPNSHQ